MYSALFAFIAVAASEPAVPTTAFGPVREPPVKVWLDRRGTVDKGDRVRVRVRTELDGYLLVLHAEPDGRVRVLFPLDPYQDNFIRGGADYELPGRGDKETFRVFTSQGIGTVFAAYSRDPFRVHEYVRGDHWDYLLAAWQVQDDAEAELVALAEQMALGRFDYDYVRYAVGRTVTAGYYDAGYRNYGTGSASSFHFYFGVGRGYVPFSYRYRRAYYYSRCHDWYWYDPYWADSWFCPRAYGTYAYYDPWYPYWHDPYYGYGWYYDRYYYQRPRPVIVYYTDGRSQPRFIDRRFTLKDDHNVADGSRLLDMRRRVPSDGATIRRTLATNDATTGRRLATEPTSGRRTVSEPTTERRPVGDRPVGDVRRVDTTTRPSEVRRPTTIERRPDVSTPAVRRPADTRRPDTGPTTVTPRRPDTGPTTVTPRRPADSGVRQPADNGARRPQPVEVKRENRPPAQPQNIRRVEPTARDRQSEPVRREVERRPPERRESSDRIRVIAPSRTEPRRVEPTRPAPQVRQQPSTVRRVPIRAVPSRTPTARRQPSPRLRSPVRVRIQAPTRRVAPAPRVNRPKAPVRKPVRRKKN